MLSINDLPTADPKSVYTDSNSPVAVTLTGSDADQDPLTFHVVSGPDHGTLSGSSPDLLYTPDPGFIGADTFTYQAYDQTACSSTATVSIAVAISEELALTKCFIATAAYGSGDLDEVVILRRFRDEVLVRYALGRRFIEFYYRHSPPAAMWLTRHDTARTAVRAMLTPASILCGAFLQ